MRIVLLAGLILCSYFVSAQLTAIKCGKLIDGKNDVCSSYALRLGERGHYY